jgi:hypothetical protein
MYKQANDKRPVPKNVRRRYFVNEAEFRMLWYEVQQVRDAEKREAFEASFKAMLHGANLLYIQVQPSINEKGGSHV